MAIDKHLNTGEYDPEKYWNARAQHSGGDLRKAVCVFAASEDENKSADRIQRHLMTRTFRILRKHGGIQGKKVLEFGCGGGRWVSFFRKYSCSWAGVDISHDMLNIARSQNKGVELARILGGHIPYPDKSFDIVYSVTVIHHNPHDAQDSIVSEMSRVLRDDGHLILFEDLGSTGGFNMFPRDRLGWIALTERHGMALTWYKGARYWILRDTAAAIKQKLRGQKTLSRILAIAGEGIFDSKLEMWRKFVDRFDLLVDQYLLPFIPSQYHTTGIMVFKKRNSLA